MNLPTVTNPGLPMEAGGGATFDPTDIILPTITIRQNTYKNEAFKKFRGGDVVLRPDMRVVANEEDGFKFIPLSIEKITKVSDVTNKAEPKFFGWELPNPEKPYEFEQGGRLFRRDTCFVVYLLDFKQAETQAKANPKGAIDPDDFAMPIRMTMTRGSMYAGKVLNTHFERCKMFNAPITGKVFQLKSQEKSNDKGNWFVFDCEAVVENGKGLKTPEAVLPIANFWAKTLANSKVAFKVADDSEDEIVETVAAPANESELNF